ncbi:hypothetical protein FOXB_09063 [Fusarium oxysporum f. sp. conglutinans Fo5176]|uniref:Uncharacterized protein n=1 Tax=Fusarium oxysporum (strain Fo5176) TaxID=660025 RepID=F9FRN2_FUSOF|nr:hypothetical protein FOXB_09063 [Fusarium oxysporum f. sp. conglutinans Fo5176]
MLNLLRDAFPKRRSRRCLEGKRIILPQIVIEASYDLNHQYQLFQLYYLSQPYTYKS